MIHSLHFPNCMYTLFRSSWRRRWPEGFVYRRSQVVGFGFYHFTNRYWRNWEETTGKSSRVSGRRAPVCANHFTTRKVNSTVNFFLQSVYLFIQLLSLLFLIMISVSFLYSLTVSFWIASSILSSRYKDLFWYRWRT